MNDTDGTMIRKLYLLLKQADSDYRISATECARSVATDWPKDCGGRSTLDERQFCSCWFELVDLCVDGVRADLT
jgi:hypothetical protein